MTKEEGGREKNWSRLSLKGRSVGMNDARDEHVLFLAAAGQNGGFDDVRHQSSPYQSRRRVRWSRDGHFKKIQRGILIHKILKNEIPIIETIFPIYLKKSISISLSKISIYR